MLLSTGIASISAKGPTPDTTVPLRRTGEPSERTKTRNPVAEAMARIVVYLRLLDQADDDDDGGDERGNADIGSELGGIDVHDARDRR